MIRYATMGGGFQRVGGHGTRWLASIAGFVFLVGAVDAAPAEAPAAASPPAAAAPAVTPPASAGSPDAAFPRAPATLLRPLRENVPFEMPVPIEPKVFAGYPGVPPFSVVPRVDQLTFYPCSNCHSAMKPNPQPRKLIAAPHPAALVHGNGRFWCLTCHQLNDRDRLHTLADQPVEYDQAYLVCGQCHFNRQKDWFFGGHGKRVKNWQGERVIYNCTFCHDPHDPTLKPRAPSAPPPVRVGLKAMQPTRHEAPAPVFDQPSQDPGARP